MAMTEVSTKKKIDSKGCGPSAFETSRRFNIPETFNRQYNRV